MEQKILVIDDLRVFHDLKPEVTWYARNSEEAINMILKDVYTETWWDHDLGGDDDSRRVLHFIERLYHTEGWIPHLGNAYVHTANPAGAKSLVLGLSKYYHTKRVNVFDMNVGVIGS